MKKIPTIFKRNYSNMKLVINEQNNECKWVFDGEGIATRKYDGTCVKIESGRYFKRREIKPNMIIPKDFIEEQFDNITDKRVGWIPINPDDNENRWHMEAFNSSYIDGTYELVGPKIQGNAEGYKYHTLIKHSDAEVFNDCIIRTFDGIANFMLHKDIEGIVFHHPDGRMAKIKKRDFGQKRL